MDHVVIRRLEHLTGRARAPSVGYAIEMRDRPGPAHKKGAFPDDIVWIQLHGGLFVAKARVELCWVGEYSSVGEVRARTRGSDIYEVKEFWRGRPRFGYAAVAGLKHEHWIEPFWGGPRTYAYEWVLLDDEKKEKTWLEHKDAPRAGEGLLADFHSWLDSMG
jgi:hypothetical protein